MIYFFFGDRHKQFQHLIGSSLSSLLYCIAPAHGTSGRPGYPLLYAVSMKSVTARLHSPSAFHLLCTDGTLFILVADAHSLEGGHQAVHFDIEFSLASVVECQQVTPSPSQRRIGHKLDWKCLLVGIVDTPKKHIFAVWLIPLQIQIFQLEQPPLQLLIHKHFCRKVQVFLHGRPGNTSVRWMFLG